LFILTIMTHTKPSEMRDIRSGLPLLVASTALALGLFIPAAQGQEKHNPGDEFQDCPDCPKMVVLPAGTYDMPAPPVDQGRPYDEGENRVVVISQPFAVGKFEVTFDEWDACARDGGCPAAEDEGWGRGRRPVINISWSEADRYTRWLSKKTRKAYRLLTEAEWEYAARAGAGRARFFGLKPEEICGYANVYDKTAEKTHEFGMEMIPCDDGFAVTAPVGSFKPNAFGLYDMLGNVWEWTEDCQSTHWRNAPHDSKARVDGKCSERAFRGASWMSHPPRYLQAADRYKFIGARYNDLGFRVALTLE
jgi:formylglycine-generating enzyme required for sulfatase activity